MGLTTRRTHGGLKVNLLFAVDIRIIIGQSKSDQRVLMFLEVNESEASTLAFTVGVQRVHVAHDPALVDHHPGAGFRFVGEQFQQRDLEFGVLDPMRNVVNAEPRGRHERVQVLEFLPLASLQLWQRISVG